MILDLTKIDKQILIDYMQEAHGDEDITVTDVEVQGFIQELYYIDNKTNLKASRLISIYHNTLFRFIRRQKIKKICGTITGNQTIYIIYKYA